MATFFAPVSLREKSNIFIRCLLSGTDGLARITHGSHIVLILPIRLW